MEVIKNEEKKVAFIIGITGQDGSYLAEFLFNKGYIVHGLIRKNSDTNHVECLLKNNSLKLHYGDLTDSTSFIKIFLEITPDEVYNLGAQTDLKLSFDSAQNTANVNAIGTLRLLDAIKTCNLEGKVKFFQACTSELYGKTLETPQNENTPFSPRSPYVSYYF